MRIPISETNDTDGAASLPPTQGTELNYRTRPDVDTEIRFTHDALKFAVGVSVVAAIAVRFLGPEYLDYAAIALFGVVWWFVPDATRPDPDAPGRTFEFRLWLVAVLVGWVVLHTPARRLPRRLTVCGRRPLRPGPRLRAANGRQMAANPKVYGDVGREWMAPQCDGVWREKWHRRGVAREIVFAVESRDCGGQFRASRGRGSRFWDG